ncbi:hypothetical protein I316_01790 [Kwoniella heveanensis BCC8398]|uniref:Uncharacterized protein n=1 Tax=Kwoniella heveanensis BCC8398 TaxID=1296120 RepID=A0A1B9GZV4_9TREE|nr:hypothetical protein I316_01790 [Kwoniella heveanensis BCC8398]
MYFDLYFPFPIPEPDETQNKKAKKGKGKAAVPAAETAFIAASKDCWTGLESKERNGIARRAALLGHLGYSVVGCTINPGEPSNQVHPSPFQTSLPFPDIDPRKWSAASASTPAASSASSSSSSSSKHVASTSQAGSNGGKPPLVQVTRYHMRLDDSRVHPLTGANTNALRNYDILSVSPTSDKAFQLACTDMSNPGPNQISIITLPLHEKPFTFRFNRKQMKQAQRNGVVFELLYSAALFPSLNLSPETAKRYRQNFLSNAREVVRITGGKGVIFSSGPGVNENGFRGPLDLVNLGTMIGMPSNLAKEAVSDAPRAVLLRAQSRRTFKAVMSTPKIVPPPSISAAEQPPVEIQAQNDTTPTAANTTEDTHVKIADDTAADVEMAQPNKSPQLQSQSQRQPHSPKKRSAEIEGATTSIKKKNKKNKGSS